MNQVVISLGSNINPERNIEQALTILNDRFRFSNSSTFLQTKPIGYTNQNDFINGTVLLKTDLDQNQLTASLKDIEKELGRKRSAIKFGPRTIDLDITVFNGKITDNDFYERDFVKNAVLELIPNLEY